MQTAGSFVEALKQNPKFMARARSVETVKGDLIIEADAQDDSLFCVLSGSVKVTNISASGREVWHTIIKAGHTFGEIAALTGQNRSASIIALERTDLLILSRVDLFEFLREDTDATLLLLQDTARRLAASTQQVQTLVTQTLSHRVAAELFQLAYTDDIVRDKISPKPNLADMAARLNTDRVRVSREISTLVQKGLLERGDTYFKLLNMTYFERATRF